MARAFDLVIAIAGELRIVIRGVVPRLPPHVGLPEAGRLRWTYPRAHLLARMNSLRPRPPIGLCVHSIEATDAAMAHSAVQGERPLVHASAAGTGPAVLFEAATYDVYLHGSAGQSGVTIAADVPEMLQEIHRIETGGGSTVTHYRLEIDNEVGVLGLELRGPETALESAAHRTRLEIEIFPRKIDYMSDYRAMLEQVAQIAPALVLDVSGRTRQSVALRSGSLRVVPEWYEILRSIAAELCAAVDRILPDPQRRLEASKRWTWTERARRISPADLERSFRKPGNVHPWPESPLKRLWPSKIAERVAMQDFDAEGNRAVKGILQKVLTQLAHLEAELQLRPSVWSDTQAGRATAARWRSEIAFIRPQIQRRLAYEWITQASSHHSGQPSASIQAHPLYSKVFELGRALLHGLHADDREFTDAATRPISALYEYWCFLALVNMLRRQASLEQFSAVQLTFQGSRLSLKRGREAAVVFRHRASGLQLRLAYNRQYTTPTVAQKPDASVHLESARYIHVFDAKYRVQFDSAYIESFGGIGPRLEDVNTMHRYRDAIVSADETSGYERIVKSACVLFPWHDEQAYEQHAFARSLDSVGIGGLPFLPTSMRLVARRLEVIVDECVANRHL